MQIFEPIKVLRQPLFARLYFAQAISLLGDSITWVGVALLAYEFGGDQSSKILATSLTLRVTSFVLFGSYAGLIADRVNRKMIMIITNIFRMLIIIMLAFVNGTTGLYVLIFCLNVFNAFFSPAYRACIPQLVNGRENYANAIALSNATWQLLGILGPGLAGILAVAWGARQIFFADAFSFIVSSILIFFIPIKNINVSTDKHEEISSVWINMKTGTALVFKNRHIRFAIFIELAGAIAGAQILVNTIGHVKSDMMLGDDEYGFIMSLFGVGATIAAFTSGILDKSASRAIMLSLGALMLSLAVTFANFASFGLLTFLWVIAGTGISFTDMPSQILIAENISKEDQGKAYGSHFAWTHLWWALGYILAGISGTYISNFDFFTGGIVAFFFLCFLLALRIRKAKASS